MATFTLPNTKTGGSQTVNASSLADAESQAQGAGTWSPAAGTYGANSVGAFDPGSAGGAGAAVSSNTSSAAAGSNYAGINAYSAQASGVTQAQLAEQQREFNAQLAWAQQMWQNQGLPQLIIQQRSQALQEQQYQFQMQQATQNMALQQAGVLGYYQAPSASATPNVVSNINQMLGNTTGGLGQPAPSPTSNLAPGTVVRTSSNQFGVVGQNGQITPGDVTNPTIAAAIRNNAGIVTVPDSAFYISGAGSGQSAASSYKPGTVLRDASNNFAVVNPDGSIRTAATTDPTVAAAINANGGIVTVPNLQAAIAAAPTPNPTGSPAAPTATSASGTVNGPNGVPLPAGAVPTLAGQQQQFTEALQAQQQQFAQAQQQAQLGLSYLTQAAQLQGPQNVFQQSNFFRGAQANPNVPLFLQSLANNTAASTLPAFQGVGSTPPNPLSMSTLTSGLTGGQGGQPFNSNMMVSGGQSGQPVSVGPVASASNGLFNTNMEVAGGQGGQPMSVGPVASMGPNGPIYNSNMMVSGGQGGQAGAQGGLMGGATGGNNPGFNADQSLQAIRNISNMGASQLAPGTLERLTPDELQAFGSGLGAIGSSLPAFMQQYQQSRPQQQAMTGDMTLSA